MMPMNLFTKQKLRHIYLENKHMDTKGGSGGGVNWDTGFDIHTLL